MTKVMFSARSVPWLALPILTMSLTIAAESPRLSSYVNPFIGTVGAIPGSAYAGGNSFPGASLPWAMAKVGIDTSYIGVHNATDANAGFTPLGNVTAISMTHVSGAGGTPTCEYSLLGDTTMLMV